MERMTEKEIRKSSNGDLADHLGFARRIIDQWDEYAKAIRDRLIERKVEEAEGEKYKAGYEKKVREDYNIAGIVEKYGEEKLRKFRRRTPYYAVWCRRKGENKPSRSAKKGPKRRNLSDNA